MTENEEVMILENLRPGCGEKLSFSEGEICETIDTAISALKEIQQYREIGTVEECREAVEKQKSKSPTLEGDGYDEDGEMIYDTWICPSCGEDYEVDYDDYDFCPNCGQRILH